MLTGPSKKPAKNFSYCSELARKVYVDLGIEKTGIPRAPIIKPCDFDRLADQAKNWVDVTESVRPFLAFCQEFSTFMPTTCKMFIDGLMLNRQRYAERHKAKIELKRKLRQGEISKPAADLILAKIREAENQLNLNFWDFQLPKQEVGVGVR